MHISLLKANLELFGLRAPAFSWLVSVVLVVYCASIIRRQLRQSKIRQRDLSDADARLSGLAAGRSAARDRRSGVSGLFLREIGNVFDDLPSLGTAWQAISSSIISRTGKNGEESFWTAEDIRGRLRRIDGRGAPRL